MGADALNLMKSFRPSSTGYDSVRKSDSGGQDFLGEVERRAQELPGMSASGGWNPNNFLFKGKRPLVVQPVPCEASPVISGLPVKPAPCEGLPIDSKPVISNLPVEPEREISGLPVEPAPEISGLPFVPEREISGLPVEPESVISGLPVQPSPWGDLTGQTHASELPERYDAQGLLGKMLAARMVDLFASLPVGDRKF